MAAVYHVDCPAVTWGIGSTTRLQIQNWDQTTAWDLLSVPYISANYAENHATFPMQIDGITAQICGNF